MSLVKSGGRTKHVICGIVPRSGFPLVTLATVIRQECTLQFHNMADTPNSGGSTPNPRFTSQAVSAEDRLKADTVGLVTLDDFRKRRAEALEGGTPGSGATTPDGR